ncbi:MAG: arginine--tRNA ligase [Gammaproteobacteria bacterium]
MKTQLRQSIDDALCSLRERGELPAEARAAYQVETPKNAAHGDYSTNVAMLLAKPCRRAPRDIAAALAAELERDGLFREVGVAGPGFINFSVDDAALYGVIDDIIDTAGAYGTSAHGAGRRVQVEFVSANPTGPLHIGHGRGAAIGSVIVRLLAAAGYAVTAEYYVNDAGRQMDILALSVYLRAREIAGDAVPFPAQAYQGGYVRDIARELVNERGAEWLSECSLPASAGAADGGEHALDEAIASVRAALGDARFGALRDHAKDVILASIRADLAAFGVEFDEWYSEASLARGGRIDDAIAVLDGAGHLYTDAGARWFRSSALGDEKDRVVVRDNGQTTYFASDIAYHLDKFRRGFQQVVNVWGADHHGYVARVRAAIEALGENPQRLDIVLVQFASLARGGEKVAMSTRSGEFVTLRELVDEVGVDAARFFYIMRRSDQHLEFDLDLATSESSDNPVYYVQYAHARICSVFRQLEERGLAPPDGGGDYAAVLEQPAERALAMTLARYPETVAAAAEAREPHVLTQYLRDLAHEFHGYYNAHRVIVDDALLRDARLRLITAVRQVLANGLDLVGIRAPTHM